MINLYTLFLLRTNLYFEESHTKTYGVANRLNRLLKDLEFNFFFLKYFWNKE
ncbi:hypothetical protein L1275_002219 [Flavobacterium sp. HSC-61S13]|nr:hypothetical protein [Flavobacterium sp. HSC-61S13]